MIAADRACKLPRVMRKILLAVAAAAAALLGLWAFAPGVLGLAGPSAGGAAAGRSVLAVSFLLGPGP